MFTSLPGPIGQVEAYETGYRGARRLRVAGLHNATALRTPFSLIFRAASLGYPLGRAANAAGCTKSDSAQ
jgi:hypothetical protein